MVESTLESVDGSLLCMLCLPGKACLTTVNSWRKGLWLPWKEDGILLLSPLYTSHLYCQFGPYKCSIMILLVLTFLTPLLSSGAHRMLSLPLSLPLPPGGITLPLLDPHMLWPAERPQGTSRALPPPRWPITTVSIESRPRSRNIGKLL